MLNKVFPLWFGWKSYNESTSYKQGKSICFWSLLLAFSIFCGTLWMNAKIMKNKTLIDSRINFIYITEDWLGKNRKNILSEFCLCVLESINAQIKGERGCWLFFMIPSSYIKILTRNKIGFLLINQPSCYLPIDMSELLNPIAKLIFLAIVDINIEVWNMGYRSYQSKSFAVVG